jgi:hypothetical protein
MLKRYFIVLLLLSAACSMNGMYEDDSKDVILGFNHTCYIPAQNKIVATSIRSSYQGAALYTVVTKDLNRNTLKVGAVWKPDHGACGLCVQPDQRCVALLKTKIAEYENQMAVIK